MLPAEATSLLLAGSILSITINPLLFRNLGRMEHQVVRWLAFSRFAERRLPETEQALALRRHVVICGYGRSGYNLVRILTGRNLPYVVVENDPFVFQRAQAAGIACVFGDASNPLVLEQTQIDEARTLAVTFATHPTSPITVQNARRLNPNLNIVARGYGPESHSLLRQVGAAEVVDPYFESSMEFVRHVLQRYGIDAREIVQLQMRWRAEHYGA